MIIFLLMEPIPSVENDNDIADASASNFSTMEYGHLRLICF